MKFENFSVCKLQGLKEINADCRDRIKEYEIEGRYN